MKPVQYTHPLIPIDWNRDINKYYIELHREQRTENRDKMIFAGLR